MIHFDFIDKYFFRYDFGIPSNQSSGALTADFLDCIDKQKGVMRVNSLVIHPLCLQNQSNWVS